MNLPDDGVRYDVIAKLQKALRYLTPGIDNYDTAEYAISQETARISCRIRR